MWRSCVYSSVVLTRSRRIRIVTFPRFLSVMNGRLSSTHSEDLGIKEFVDYLESLKNYEKLGVPKGAGTDSSDGFDLCRMRRLLHSLGDPHLEFKAVHIAGTKGKGSTAQFISNILRMQGYNVGCYTSPHLLSLRERMTLGKDGCMVSVEVLNELFHSVKGIIDQSIQLEKGYLTHFEVLTALAFTLFAQQKVNIAVVETGLGGARDATNVLHGNNIAVSVITTIGKEHLDALGGSLESIAVAKSGIMKQGRPVVIGGPFLPNIEQILHEQASMMSSPLVSASDPRIQSMLNGLLTEDGRIYQICDILVRHLDLQFTELFGLKLQMLGKYQLQNAVTATCTALLLRNQGWVISDQSIRAGLEHTFLLGRSQFLTKEEIELLGISGVSVLIDGAHTEAAAVGLAELVNMTKVDTKLAFVVAMASDKDHAAFANQLILGVRPDIVVFTEVSIAGSKSRMTAASSLKETWMEASKRLKMDIHDLGNIRHENQLPSTINRNVVSFVTCDSRSVNMPITLACKLLRGLREDNGGLIVVTGSLHVVAAVLESLDC